MIDQDGACTDQDVRESLSFCSHQFDVFNEGCIGYEKNGSCLGGDVPNKYHTSCDAKGCSFSPSPKIPVISHETGNYNTYPRIQSLIQKFNSSGSTIRPYWLSPALAKLNASGLTSEVDAWATASEQLYVTCWKLDIEDHRHNDEVSGYEWWLLQDYWTGNNGVVDTFMNPKPGVAPYIKAFNARSILVQSGLALSYSSKDPFSVEVSLSNFGDSDLTPGGDTKISWSVLLDGKVIKTDPAAAVQQPVAQGTLGVVVSIDIAALPDVGTTASILFGATDGPKTLTVTAQLTGSSSFAGLVPKNSWNATLFPRWEDSKSPSTTSHSNKQSAIQVTNANLLKSCGFSDCVLSDVDPDPKAPAAVYLTSTINDALIQSVKQAGSVVVLLESTSTGFFKTTATRFKQAWWLGSATDNNAGTLVYDNAAAILGGMAPDHFADQTWWRMVNGAQTFLLDEMPTLPGTWSPSQKGVYGQQDGCTAHGPHPCPAAFPFPTHGPKPFKGVVCYKTQAEASTGEGPCGSWCTMDVSIGDGCAPNSAHICPATPAPSSCKPVSAVATVGACEALCDASPGCSVVNYNASQGCCLQNCGAAALGPPKAAPDGACCGFYRETGGSMPRNLTVGMRAIDVVTLSRNKALLWSVPLGKGHVVATGLKLLGANESAAAHPEQAWVLDRLLRYAASLV